MKDANGSIEGVENPDGRVAPENRYAYDPYGEQTAPEAGLGQPAKDNPQRFEGFRYDSGTKIYDMQARAYRPDVGRFLTQDRFESASGDFALQSDPLTQNRYAFAGGNPVSRVEWDGHFHITDDGRRVRNVPPPRGNRGARRLKIGRTWLLDSGGHLALRIEKSANGYAAYLPDNTQVTNQNGAGVFLPTIKAFRDSCGPRGRVLVSFDATNEKAPPIYANKQFRGFAARSRVYGGPPRGANRGCGRKQGRYEGRYKIKNPAFDPGDRYIRPDGVPYGDYYAAYNERANGSIYVSSGTVAVSRGGVAHGVVGQVRVGRTFVRYGYFRKCDEKVRLNPNTGGLPRVGWSFGAARVRGRTIWGWIPTRALARSDGTPAAGCS